MKKVVLNDWAFAAVVGNSSDVVTWGNKKNGGSIVPPPNHLGWKERDVKRAKPETLVATCCAFAFIRQV